MRIKYLTLNIWCGGILLDNAISFLKKEAPDIIALQEVYHGTDRALDKRFRTVSLLREQLAYKYYAFAPTHRDTSPEVNVDRGNLVLSKFPIVDQKITFFDIPYGDFSEVTDNKSDYIKTPRNIQHVVINNNGIFFNVFNVHGIWDFHGKDNERRLQQSKTLLKVTDGVEHTIVSGDFNVRPDTRSVGMIEERLHNVFKNELKSTFNMQHKTDPGFAESVVDYIFISHDFKVTSKNCPLVDVSDHLPLVCELSDE